jgi:hypothetical protein
MASVLPQSRELGVGSMARGRRALLFGERLAEICAPKVRE